VRTVVDDCGGDYQLTGWRVEGARPLEHNQRCAHAGRRQRDSDRQALSHAGAERDGKAETDEQRPEHASGESDGSAAQANLFEHRRLHLQPRLHNLRASQRESQSGRHAQRSSGLRALSRQR
jgi:hypothetical protein